LTGHPAFLAQAFRPAVGRTGSPEGLRYGHFATPYQYSTSLRSAAAIVSAFGRFAASRMCENGGCVSG